MSAQITQRNFAPVEDSKDDWKLVLAAAAKVDTPVNLIYRDWRELHDWINGPASNGITDGDLTFENAELNRLLKRMLETPSGGLMDTITKLVAAIEGYQLFSGIEELKPLEAEARAMVQHD